MAADTDKAPPGRWARTSFPGTEDKKPLHLLNVWRAAVVPMRSIRRPVVGPSMWPSKQGVTGQRTEPFPGRGLLPSHVGCSTPQLQRASGATNPTATEQKAA